MTLQLVQTFYNGFHLLASSRLVFQRRYAKFTRRIQFYLYYNVLLLYHVTNTCFGNEVPSAKMFNVLVDNQPNCACKYTELYESIFVFYMTDIFRFDLHLSDRGGCEIQCLLKQCLLSLHNMAHVYKLFGWQPFLRFYQLCLKV